MQYAVAHDGILTLEQKYETLRNGFNSGKLKSIEYRRYQLLQLAYMLKENDERILDALKQDLGRPAVESRLYVLPRIVVSGV